jgi:tetratricopeptide (TPR) repeat protein
LLELTLSIYTPVIDFYVLLNDFESAHGALNTATGMLSPPADKFMAFSAAMIHARENDIDAARKSLKEAQEVIDQFNLKYLESQIHLVEALISEKLGDFRAMAGHCRQAIEQINQAVVAGGLQIGVAQIYAQMARAQIRYGDPDAAEKSIEAGFVLDPSEPLLWVEKARLQQARNMPQMALASINYALAIWKDADEEYIEARDARALAAQLRVQ